MESRKLIQRQLKYLLTTVPRHAVRVSPQFTNRMIDSARGVLNRYIPDIYIYSDIYKGDEAGKYVYSFSTSILCLHSPDHRDMA